jgi:short-subunit dehydrogenase
MKMADWLARNVSHDDHVVITGTSSGIGLAYSRAFSKAGCNLICIGNEADSMATQKSALEGEFGNKIENIDLDLRDITETKRVAKDLGDRRIKVLVNNAGFGLKGRFESHEIDEYIDIVAVNVTAPIVLTRSVIPQMIQRGSGAIIHIASINAIVPIPNNQVYTATKAFCASYASAVARENKGNEIKFQLVLPGTTRTPFHDRQGANPKNLVMEPADVVAASFDSIDREVCIPNPVDRILAKIVPFLPRNAAMDIAAYMLKKRLGL